MKKYLYKTTRVVHDAHLHEYRVEYKNWFTWNYDSCYKYYFNRQHQAYYTTHEQAKERAINRAASMLDTTVVWQQSTFLGM